MVDLWPHGQHHLWESDLLLKISHYTSCATGRSHASTVWLQKNSRTCLQIQIVKLLLTIKLTQGSSRRAYLMGESVPTYLPRYWLSRYFGILPAYLPRDRFLPSELAVPLVDAHYCQDYRIWKRRLDANIGATHYLVDHLRDPSGTGVPYCQSIEAPVSIPFVHTVGAAELRWWHRYLITYHSFNDLILLRGHYRNSLNYHISTVTWHMGKSAQDIYATALTILQVGQPS
jgi:hypothetical protein